MDERVICFSEYRAKKDQSVSDHEVLRISEEVGKAAVTLVRQFAEQYPVSIRVETSERFYLAVKQINAKWRIASHGENIKQ